MSDFPKLFMCVGAALVMVGALMKLGVPLGRLPGDIVIQNETFSFYFPMTTCILVSIILTLIIRGLR